MTLAIAMTDELDDVFGAPPLLAASIRVTSRCNLSCRHCYVDDPRDPGLAVDRLDTREVVALIDELCELGCAKLFLTGGEPFLRPDLVDLLRHARSRGLGLAISTNGTVATRDVLESMADLPFDLFQVSVDGPEVYHDGNRGPGAFAAARETFAALARLGFENRTVGCTVGAANHRHLPEMVRVANDLRATHVSVTLEIEGGRCARNEVLHELAASLREFGRRMTAEGGALELSRTSTIPVALVPPTLLERFGAERFLMCSYPYTLGIDSIGNVAPCDGFFGAKQSPLGSAVARPLSEVWLGDAANAVRRLAQAPPRGVCGICRRRAVCGGGCRANAVARSDGDHSAPDPVCQAFFDHGLFPAAELDPGATEGRTP
jgi:radical SAM protein with 4Fe4S-binding SPASM domain